MLLTLTSVMHSTSVFARYLQAARTKTHITKVKKTIKLPVLHTHYAGVMEITKLASCCHITNEQLVCTIFLVDSTNGKGI